MTPTFSHRSSNGTNWYLRKRAKQQADQYVTWADLKDEERAAIVVDRLKEPSLRRSGGTSLDALADVLRHSYTPHVLKQLQVDSAIYTKLRNNIADEARFTPMSAPSDETIRFRGIPVVVNPQLPPNAVMLISPNGKTKVTI